MYEYKYVKLKVKGVFVRRPEKEDYHAIIEEHAKQGWRLVQILTPPIGSYGVAPFYEIIFERQK